MTDFQPPPTLADVPDLMRLREAHLAGKRAINEEISRLEGQILEAVRPVKPGDVVTVPKERWRNTHEGKQATVRHIGLGFGWEAPYEGENDRQVPVVHVIASVHKKDGTPGRVSARWSVRVNVKA